MEGCTLHAWNDNPQASIAYQVRSSGNVFMTFADRGRFPILKEIYTASMGSGLPNPGLLPERSRNWNVGYSQLMPLRTFLQFQLFRSDLRNAIESVYVSDPGGTGTAFCPNSKISGYCLAMVNIGHERHEGLEFSVGTTPVSRLTGDVSYSYLYRTLAYDFASVPGVSQVLTSVNVLPTLPTHKLIATATIQLPRRIVGQVSGRYEAGLTLQDTTYPTSSPLFKPYTRLFGTMDLAAVIPVYGQVRVQAGVKNVFDREYYYTAGYPEQGRNWLVNLCWQF